MSIQGRAFWGVFADKLWLIFTTVLRKCSVLCKSMWGASWWSLQWNEYQVPLMTDDEHRNAKLSWHFWQTYKTGNSLLVVSEYMHMSSSQSTNGGQRQRERERDRYFRSLPLIWPSFSHAKFILLFVCFICCCLGPFCWTSSDFRHQNARTHLLGLENLKLNEMGCSVFGSFQSVQFPW